MRGRRRKKKGKYISMGEKRRKEKTPFNEPFVGHWREAESHPGCTKKRKGRIK